MKEEKVLEQLKKSLASYTKTAEALKTKKTQISAELKDVEQRLFKVFDAIQVLEGKSTLSKMIESSLATPNGLTGTDANARIVSHTDSGDVDGLAFKLTTQDQVLAPAAPYNENELPPAEPGFRWAKNDAGEDILIPITPLRPMIVPGVVERGSDTPEFSLPTEDEHFDDPSGFID